MLLVACPQRLWSGPFIPRGLGRQVYLPTLGGSLNQGEPAKAYPFLELVFSATTLEELGMFYQFHRSGKATKVQELHSQVPSWWLVQRSVKLQAGLGQCAFHSSPRATVSLSMYVRMIDRQTAMAKGNTVNLDLGVCDRNQSRLF